jgi:hypothetical protein
MLYQAQQRILLLVYSILPSAVYPLHSRAHLMLVQWMNTIEHFKTVGVTLTGKIDFSIGRNVILDGCTYRCRTEETRGVSGVPE